MGSEGGGSVAEASVVFSFVVGSYTAAERLRLIGCLAQCRARSFAARRDFVWRTDLAILAMLEKFNTSKARDRPCMHSVAICFMLTQKIDVSSVAYL